MSKPSSNSTTQLSQKQPIVVALGEMLWDMLPSDKRAGGAPTNFSYHAGCNGARSYALSAVGNDELGDELLNAAKQAGIQTIVQRNAYPTGTVDVELNDGIPQYTIVEGVAWDHIQCTNNLIELMQQADAVCFGTLACRNPESQQSIMQLVNATKPEALRFFDINIRGDYYSNELIEQELEAANVFKINDEELVFLRQLCDLEGSDDEVCRALIERYDLKYLILTAGSQYSTIYAANGEQSTVRTPHVQVADTVGAGDSFSGTFTARILLGDPLRQAHVKAVNTAAFVCTNQGAWPAYPQVMPDYVSLSAQSDDQQHTTEQSSLTQEQVDNTQEQVDDTQEHPQDMQVQAHTQAGVQASLKAQAQTQVPMQTQTTNQEQCQYTEPTPIAPAQYRLDTIANRAFLGEQYRSLIAFGKHFPSKIGGAGWLNDDGSIDESRGVQTWITCRMAHVYSIAHMGGDPDAMNLVDAAVSGLLGVLHDDEHGGWYPGVDAAGEPEKGKICYTHAFVMLAASSALLAGHPKAQQLLDEAVSTFDEHFWDDDQGLAVDTWDTSFSALDNYRGLNANMHTTEAFLALADATGNNSYRERAGRIIDHVIQWAQGNDWRIPEHFTCDWQPDLDYNFDTKDDQFKPYGATPGHGIEWSRLIAQWTLSSFNNARLSRAYLDASVKLFTRALADGWSGGLHPGLSYTTDWSGNTVVGDRMHWTLAEGLNTAAVLARATNEPVFYNWYATFASYIDTYLIDRAQGSWFHQLNSSNELIGTVWPGKSDLYHAFQATLIPYLDPSVSIATAVCNDMQQDQ